MDYEDLYLGSRNVAKMFRDSGVVQAEYIDRMFPELGETEDEHMLKAILKFTKGNTYLYQDTARGRVSKEAMIEFLEKQIEKLNKNYNVRKFEVGDVVTNGENTYTICRISSDCYLLEEHDCATIPFDSERFWEKIGNKGDCMNLL